jgi:hypothetical protein
MNVGRPLPGGIPQGRSLNVRWHRRPAAHSNRTRGIWLRLFGEREAGAFDGNVVVVPNPAEIIDEMAFQRGSFGPDAFPSCSRHRRRA